MLEEVVNDEKAPEFVTKANGILTVIKGFEFTLMVVIFNQIMQTTNILSKILQGSEIDLTEAFLFIDTCIKEVQELRNDAKERKFELRKFDEFIAQAREITEMSGTECDFAIGRARKRKRQFDELCSDEASSEPKECFKCDVFFRAIDIIDQQMNERFGAHRQLLQAFQCLSPDRLLKQHDDNIRMLETLVAEYGAKDGTGDINDDVLNEYQIFQARYKETDGIDILVKKRVLIKKKVRKVYKVQQIKQKCRSPKDIFEFLYTSKLHKVFPNLYKLYQIFLTVPVTTAEAERTFSKLKLIKNHQRSRMKQEKGN